MLRRHQFGTFLGGPVLLPGYNGRNRTFWSFNYEGRREMSESVGTGWFPSPAMRAGDSSQLLSPVDASGVLVRQPIVIYDPQTGTPFPNNVIPQDRINTGAKNLCHNSLSSNSSNAIRWTSQTATLFAFQWSRTHGSFAATTISAARTVLSCVSRGISRPGTVRQSTRTLV
jgi:hypothetical protein